MSKPYRIWLMLTSKSDDFRLISVTLWNYTAPILACSMLSDSGEDAKKWEVRALSQFPRTRLSRSLEQATPTLVDRHISGGQVFVPLFGAVETGAHIIQDSSSY